MSRLTLILGCIWGLLLVAWVGKPAHAINTSTQTTLDAVTSNSTGTKISVKGWTTAVFHVCCTFTGTVKFLASGDSTNEEAIACISIADPTAGYVTAVVSRGMYRCNVIGINGWIRADVTGYASGSISVVVGLASAGVT
jgi:hypothetical protein